MTADSAAVERGPYYADGTVTLLLGDALDVLRGMPDGSVDCCVTSPPYFALRDYGVEGQYGLEASPAEYVERMRGVFAEVRRVLAPDGVLWCNIDDTYSSAAKGSGGTARVTLGGGPATGSYFEPRAVTMDRATKNLLGIPWRVAFALQDDGWVLRNAIVWEKPNAMPSSVTDRLSNRYETVFLFARQRTYWFDLDALREPHAPATVAAATRARKPYQAPGQSANLKTRSMADAGANPGDVWSIASTPYPEAHFATFPVELPRRAIAAGCKPGGTVLDPFSGSGTTGVAARMLGRRYVGIDLNAEYHDLAIKRYAQGVL